MLRVVLKFKKLDKCGKLGSYRFKGDAGLDLYSIEGVTINPGESIWVRTGLAVEIPRRYVGFIKEKSSLAQAFTVGAGVIDSAYRGEVKVCVRNLTDRKLKIKKGQAIAQLVILPFVLVKTREILQLSLTKRGKRGLGSQRLSTRVVFLL